MTVGKTVAGLHAVALLALLLILLPAPVAADPILRLDQAEFILSDATEPPPDSAPWKPQKLPDNWELSRPDTSGYAWYRLRFDLPSAPAETYGVYIPLLRTVGAIYVNGVEIARNGVFEKPALWGGPESFSIPEGRLREGANTLLLRLWVNKGWRGAVTAVNLGPQAAIQAKTHRDRFIAENGAQMACAFAFVLGVYVLLLWARRPHEGMYGYFGLAAVVKALVISRNFVSNPPIPLPYWDGITYSALFLAGALLFFYCLRFAGWRWPKVERGLWAWTVVWVVISWVLAVFYIPWLGNIWEDGWFLTYGSSLVLLLYIAWRLRTLESVLLVFAHSFSMVAASYDLYMDKTGDLDAINLYPYHLVPLFLVIGWILIDRFAKSLNETEQLNAELEQRVAQKHAELEANYQRLHTLEQQQAIVAERQRIMSDMHDGIAAQLMTALTQVEQGQMSSEDVAQALRECLDDLRMTIDSLEPTENDLLAVLGNLRYRLEPRLKKCGIELDWQVQDVPKLACLNPRNVLHILRILQEAFTNVLKHAHASLISVETGLDGGNRVFIRVRDNGSGFAGDHKGRGLDNMQHRARTVGGDLQIQPSPTGTTLNLLLPVA